MIVRILKNNKGYNCPCWNCGKEQEGRKKQPYLVYYKNKDEKRGHNLPVCSVECVERTIRGFARIPNTPINTYDEAGVL